MVLSNKDRTESLVHKYLIAHHDITGRSILRVAILRLLKEKGELTGYDIIKEIELRTGYWRPSPGTIYPILKDLEARAIVTKRREGRRKIYSLTPKGAQLASQLSEIADSIRRSMSRFLEAAGALLTEETPSEFKEALRELKVALVEVDVTDPEVARQVERILKEAAERIRALVGRSQEAAEF